MKPSAGNVLGELTAEADGRMLRDAFFESRSYQELVHGTDFRFVVGRRGSGKSALFRKVSAALSNQPGVVLLSEHPAEEKALAFQSELASISRSYLEVRHVTRLTWRLQVLTDALGVILANYKAAHLEEQPYLLEYRQRHEEIFRHQGMARSLQCLRVALRHAPTPSAANLPEFIAEHFDIRRLQIAILHALERVKKRVVFLYDGLDEGWVPEQHATGVVGGLARVAAEFKETTDLIHCTLFIRDNMLRALAQFDGDYTRNIEGNTLRLQWDEDSLLSLACRRLRASFGWTDEQDIRVWNKFAHRGIEGRDGFRNCLKLTLYRPRDVIALLNGAYHEAVRGGRDRIIDTDVEATATRISKNRLSDLYKEYEHVLPGLPMFADVFRSRPSRSTYATTREVLETAVGAAHSGVAARDFALLDTGDAAFNALYSVGFLGVQEDTSPAVRFCHDGSNTDVQSMAAGRMVVIHPCYWRALDVQDEAPEQVVLRVDDQDDVATTEPTKQGVQDLRLRKLGTVVEELPRIKPGREDAHRFEEWVLTTARYLFAKGLDNIEWKPNTGLLQQRDVVGTNSAAFGFWKRISRDYDVGQFVIECKNYEQVEHTEFRQSWGYMVPPYGRCLMMVTRTEDEAISETERALVCEGYSTQKKLVFIVPAILLQRALRKMRSGNEKRDDYINELLTKRLDKFERSYVAVRVPRSRQS